MVLWLFIQQLTQWFMSKLMITEWKLLSFSSSVWSPRKTVGKYEREIEGKIGWRGKISGSGAGDSLLTSELQTVSF